MRGEYKIKVVKKMDKSYTDDPDVVVNMDTDERGTIVRLCIEKQRVTIVTRPDYTRDYDIKVYLENK